MNDPQIARLAVIGVGGMGSSHAREIFSLENTQLVAACDLIPERAEKIAVQYNCQAFTDYRHMLEACALDGIVIATPHYDHTPISIAGLERGLHVLTEKPIAVHVQDAQKMIAAYEAARHAQPALVFAIMFQMRTYGQFKKIKSLIDEGELGHLVRATWLITDWFRSQYYYDNGDWRATWKGEGGGVLLNQCPHNLDLYQWFFGLPKRVAGFVSLGKYHHIEVEDEVTAYFEYENGMVGHFITTTAESPGTNRLEIVGEKGKLVYENDRLVFHRNNSSMLEFIQTSTSSFEQVENIIEEIPFEHSDQPAHRLVLNKFADAILHNTPLVVNAPEGIRSLELGNAIMLSSAQGKPVELPIDAAAYSAWLAAQVKTSRFQKDIHPYEVADLNKSFR